MVATLRDFVDTTSLHGPSEIYHAKSSLGRCYYSVILLALVALGIYFTYTVIISYRDAPISTTVSAVEQEHLRLPEVGICYSGVIDIEKLIYSGLSMEAVRALHLQFQLSGLPVNAEYIRRSSEFFLAAKPEILDFMKRQNITDYDGLLEYASFDCSALIQVYGQLYTNVPAGTPQDYLTYNSSCKSLATLSHDMFGLCYVLPPITQHLPYINAGWIIVLSAPLDHIAVDDMYYTRGFALEFAEKYDVRTGQAFKLPLNTSVVVSLLATKFNRLQYRQWPRPYEMRCYRGTNKGEEMNCANVCYLMNVAKACHCLPFRISKKKSAYYGLHNLPICWPDIENNVTCQSLSSMHDCMTGCKPVCDEITYEVTVTYGNIGAEQIMLDLELAGAVHGVIHLQIAYNAMRYIQIDEQDTMGLDSCISNIGGMFGLWLGGSVFTIVHLLTALCGCCGHKAQEMRGLFSIHRTWAPQVARHTFNNNILHRKVAKRNTH